MPSVQRNKQYKEKKKWVVITHVLLYSVGGGGFCLVVAFMSFDPEYGDTKTSENLNMGVVK